MWAWLEHYGDATVEGMDLLALLIATPALYQLLVRPPMSRWVANLFALSVMGAAFLVGGLLVAFGIAVAGYFKAPPQAASLIFVVLLPVWVACLFLLQRPVIALTVQFFKHLLTIGIILAICARILAFIIAVHKALGH